MPIDAAKVKGAQTKAVEFSWNQDQIILYALGLGVGYQQDPVDKKKVLQYTYENGLKVMPTYGVVPAFPAMGGLMGMPGLSFNPMMLLHGEQYTEILKAPLPVKAKTTTVGTVSGVYDKGKGALLVLDAITKDESGTPILKNTFAAFIRGEGGFGGEKGPEPGNEPPARAPDAVIEYPTMGHQAILYRLSGDKNPLHIDPMMAKMGKFDKPILHGLCTFGNVGRAAIEAFADNNPEKFKSIKVRFASPVYPGETIKVEMWKESATEIICQARIKERKNPDGTELIVVSNARVSFFA